MVNLSQIELGEILTEMTEAARIVGALLLKSFCSPTEVRMKTDNTPVTDLDAAAEALAAEYLQKRFPSFGFVGEEGTKSNPDSQFKFVVDPLDGTRSYAAGIPTFGTNIAFVKDDNPLLGVIYHPAVSKMLTGGADHGTFLNGAKILPNSRGALVDNDIILTSTPRMFGRANQREAWQAVQAWHPNLRIYNDCFGHSLVIQGSIRVGIECAVEPWDVLATEALIIGLGMSFKKVETSNNSSKTLYIFGETALVTELTEIITRGPEKSF